MKRLLILLAFVLASCAKPEQALVLTYGSQYSPNHPFSRADRIWMAWVEKESNGAIRIKPSWAGGLLSAEESMLEVRHGVVDIGLVTPIYLRAGAHMLRTQAGFYGGSRGYEDQLAVYHCIAREFPAFAKETEGLKVLAVQGGNLPGVLTRQRPVTTLEDFRGLRLRTPVELNSVLKELGADPVNMPMGEVYSALAKGVIDGVVSPTDALQSMHFNEVARHFALVRIARGAYPARAMSLRMWNRLPPDAQAVLEKSIPVWEEAMRTEISGAAATGEAYGRKGGVAFTDFDPAAQAKMDALYTAEAGKEAARYDRRFGTDEATRVLVRAQEIIAARKAGDETCGEAP